MMSPSQLHPNTLQVQGWEVMDETFSGSDNLNRLRHAYLSENLLVGCLFGFSLWHPVFHMSLGWQPEHMINDTSQLYLQK